MQLNEKHLEEEIDHTNVQKITTKYHSNHRKYRHEQVEEPKKQCNKIFTSKKLAIKIIMDCRRTIWCHFNQRIITASKSNELIWRRNYAHTIKCFKL